MPAGIGDFGVSATDGGYEYNSTAFRGTITIDGFNETSFYGLGSGGPVTTRDAADVQLNLVLNLTNGTRSLAFWVQNVFELDYQNGSISAAAHQWIAFLDNIWNFSYLPLTAPRMPSGTVVGNGTIASQTNYVFVPRTTYPGNQVNLTDPVTVDVQTISGDAHGIPYVRFEYDDGFGWVAYDNVSFPWARGWVDHHFRVDGFQLAPNGDAFDADWTVDGAGSGSTGVMGGPTRVHLALEYDNGHNLQAVTNAFDYGLTGEASENVSVEPAGLSGTPGANLSEGPGLPGPLFGGNGTGWLNVSTGVPSGTLEVGGDSVPFVGGGANLTLLPGPYNLELRDGHGTVLGSDNRTVGAGTYRSIDFVGTVRFQASGLPESAAWSVELDGLPYPARGPTLELTHFLGRLSYSVAAPSGFVAEPASGSFVLNDTGATVAIVFGPADYPVVARATGLPNPLGWWLELNGTKGQAEAGGEIDADLANGTYPYEVGAYSYAFVPAAPFGNLTVSGAPAELEITFGPRYAILEGTVAPASAAVTLNGTPVLVASGSFQDRLVAGEYRLQASASGFRSLERTVTLTPGNATEVALVLVALPGPAPPGVPGPFGGWTSLAAAATWSAVAVAAAAIYLVRRRRTVREGRER
jgi:thermopsin